MKTISLWKRFLIRCLFIAFLTACVSAPLGTTEPEPTATTEPEPTAITEPEPTATTEPEPTATIKPTMTPLPFIEGTEFPVGTFEHVGGHWVIEFREDGTDLLYSKRPGFSTYEMMYAVNGNLYTDLSFDPTGIQVPATYFWTYDGELLTFQLWGEDLRPTRRGYLHGQTWRFVEEAEPISTTNTVEFPTGRFLSEDGLRAFNFDDDGTWHFFETNLEEPLRSGKYVTNVTIYNIYMEMTHDDPDLRQVPVIYIWTYDGEQLTFELWGEDVIEDRKGVYDGQTYTRIDE